MVVHTKARALLEWLVPHTAHFPREHRHTVTRHICELTLAVHDLLVAARHLTPPARAQVLCDADISLDQLRQYLHLAWRWQWLNDGQFQHVSGLTDELGKLIGGWRRAGAPQVAALSDPA
jgi:23S rRNA-intervening sequence protein